MCSYMQDLETVCAYVCVLARMCACVCVSTSLQACAYHKHDCVSEWVSWVCTHQPSKSKAVMAIYKLT